MNRLFRLTGCILCLAGVLVTLDGHWSVVQSYAWVRMFVGFSRTASVGQALSMTLDGKHPCSLCLKVMRAAQQDKQEQRRHPWVVADQQPELFLEAHRTLLPDAPSAATLAVPVVHGLHDGLVESPPTPPPRSVPAAA